MIRGSPYFKSKNAIPSNTYTSIALLQKYRRKNIRRTEQIPRAHSPFRSRLIKSLNAFSGGLFP